jgi:hypothetical protein
MTSIIFYWFLWGIWIIAAFLMDKTRLRNQLMFAILVFILLSGYSVHVYPFKINMAWFGLIIWGYSKYKKLSFFRSFTLMLSNLTITVCYVLIRIYWLMDPAIFLIIHKWMFTVLLTGLLMGIVKPLGHRLSTAAIAICQGDLVLSILFYPYDTTLGESDCITAFAISFTMILAWSWSNHLAQRIQASLTKQLNQRF